MINEKKIILLHLFAHKFSYNDFIVITSKKIIKKIMREKFLIISMYFSKLFLTKIRILLFRHGGWRFLTPKLLSMFARIAKREVRGSIPVRDDGNFTSWSRFTLRVKLVHCQRKRCAIRIPLSLCFIISWIRNCHVFKFLTAQVLHILPFNARSIISFEKDSNKICRLDIW